MIHSQTEVWFRFGRDGITDFLENINITLKDINRNVHNFLFKSRKYFTKLKLTIRFAIFIYSSNVECYDVKIINK